MYVVLGELKKGLSSVESTKHLKIFETWKNSVSHESTKAYPFYRFASNESVPWPEFLVAQSEAFQHYPNISQPHTVGTLVGQLAKNLATGRARSCRGHITCSRWPVVVVAVHWLCFVSGLDVVSCTLHILACFNLVDSWSAMLLFSP